MDLAILITSLVVGFFLAGLALERQVKYRRTLERLVQAEIDRVTTAKYLLEAHQELENYRLGDTEEFVKFLSTSREWAFDFIDDFQVSVQSLFSVLNDPEHKMEEAVAKFEELKRFLPKEL
jgi:lipoate synthase